MKKYRLMLASVAVLGAAQAATTIDPSNPNAYGANIGWVNAEADGANGAVIGQAFCSGYMYSANCGWICLGDGMPEDGMAYANDSAGDFGVNHDGVGNLTGYAYGANIGWITFEQSNGSPQVDLQTGALSGYAWGANVGWIRLTGLVTLSLDSGPDTDADSIPDWWEYSRYGKLNWLGLTPTHDRDGDGVSDVDEYLADTDPVDDTDYLAITDYQRDGQTDRVFWMVKGSRRYALERAAALTNGVEWTAEEGFVPAADAEHEEVVSGVTNSVRFYRVIASPPLSQ